MTGVLVGGVVVRLVMCWPVWGSVVVAVVIVTCELLEGWMEAPTAKTADRLLADRWRSGLGKVLGW